jgi:hypothetical protein
MRPNPKLTMKAISRCFILLVAVATVVTGCASKTVTVTSHQELHGLVGRRVALVGTASHNCPGAMLLGDGDCYVFIEGMKDWPERYERQAVQVVGWLVEHHQPDLYFIHHAKLTPLGRSGSTDRHETQEIRDLLQHGERRESR